MFYFVTRIIRHLISVFENIRNRKIVVKLFSSPARLEIKQIETLIDAHVYT